MSVGNAKYNMLFNPEEKHYISTSNEIDANNKNDSHAIIVNAISENSKVLDVGCSFGYMGEWLVKNKNCRLHGIDIDTKAINFIKSVGLYEDVNYVDLDVASELNSKDYITFSNLDNDFDYIICADLLEHLKDPTSILKLLSSKLKLGGKIMVSIPNIANIDVVVNLIEGRFNYSNFGLLDNTHLRFFTRKSFTEWIYSINKYSKDYIFDLDNIGSTKVIPELTQELKQKYPVCISSLIKFNPELRNFQNIFSLTKIEKHKEKDTNLLRILKTYRTDYVIESINENVNKTTDPINLENSYEFPFESLNDNLCGLEILTATFKQELRGELTLEIVEENNGVPVITKHIDLGMIHDNKWARICFDSIEDSIGKKYKLCLRVRNTEQNLAVWTDEDGIPCIRLFSIRPDFQFENSIEEWEIIKNIELKVKDCLKINYDKVESLEGNNEYINKLIDENKRLKSIVKELLEELI